MPEMELIASPRHISRSWASIGFIPANSRPPHQLSPYSPAGHRYIFGRPAHEKLAVLGVGRGFYDDVRAVIVRAALHRDAVAPLGG